MFNPSRWQMIVGVLTEGAVTLSCRVDVPMILRSCADSPGLVAKTGASVSQAGRKPATAYALR